MVEKNGQVTKIDKPENVGEIEELIIDELARKHLERIKALEK